MWKTHPQARDWTEAAAPSLCSPPGPSHTLPPHMTSQTYWPLKIRPQKNEVRGQLLDETSPQKFPLHQPHSKGSKRLSHLTSESKLPHSFKANYEISCLKSRQHPIELIINHEELIEQLK